METRVDTKNIYWYIGRPLVKAVAQRCKELS